MHISPLERVQDHKRKIKLGMKAMKVMNIDPYVPKSQFSLQTKLNPSQDALQSQTSDASADQQSAAFQNESMDFQAQTSAETEPQQICFDAPQSMAPSMAIQDWDQPVDSPDAQKILEYIHETENQNIKTLLEGLQKSLDHAHKIQQENMRHYYEKVKPQMEQLKQALQETLIQEKSAQVENMQQNLSQLESLIQQMRAALPEASLAQQHAVARVLNKLNEVDAR